MLAGKAPTAKVPESVRSRCAPGTSTMAILFVALAIGCRQDGATAHDEPASQGPVPDAGIEATGSPTVDDVARRRGLA